MNKDKAIAAVYKILPMYEEVLETQSEMVYRAYLAYLSRLSVMVAGIDDGMTSMVRGLEALGSNADHDQVRRTVFHMIHVLDKDGECDAV